MGGRHAGRRSERFWRDLFGFGLKVLFWGAVVIGAIWVFQQIPSLGAGSDDAEATVAPTEESASSAPTSEVPSTTSTTEPILTPADVTILVLNSTNRSGLAGRLTETIAGLGYSTLGADNYGTLLEDSVLWYAAGFEDEAEELARVLPNMAVEPNPQPPQADLVIVLGSSFEE